MAGQHADLWWQAAVMLVMALACLPCVQPLWRSGSAAAGRMMMGSALGMVAFHGVLLLYPGWAGGGHRHDGIFPASVGSASAGSPFGMLALIGWELVAAMLAATWLRRSTVQRGRQEAGYPELFDRARSLDAHKEGQAGLCGGEPPVRQLPRQTGPGR
ncbi:hypothetical protein J2M54_05385 [Arthrobacter sp. zg-ZUI227]|nr:hypothetical protein [Arthrobacter jiangjiafuii]